jgi:hypothetical protein
LPDFYDITEPGDFLPDPSTPWWIWMLAGLGCLLVLIIIYLIFRKSKSAKQRITQLDKARKQLAQLRQKTDALAPHIIAIRISLIIRRYLATAFDDPALFETIEEFSLRESALSQLHPDSREPITRHLTALSQLKYAPKESANAAELIDDAEAILAHIEINVGEEDKKKAARSRKKKLTQNRL